MKLPSLEYLANNAKVSFLRFPFTILSSLLAVGIGIYLVEYENDIANMFPFINTLLCASLGIPLYFCAAVVAQKRKWSAKTTWLLHLYATLVLVALYFTLPDANLTQNTSLPYIRFGIYNITIHLLVSFIPFLASRQLNGFWNYNKILFIRFWTAVLYSGFLYLGLTLALVSLKLLFDVDIHDKLFFELYILIIGFFNTWFFVAGIPKDFDALDAITEYPKGLKIFSQYVLLPLLILYLFILYGYGGKIVLLWDWPKGIVSYLIACVSVLGILTFLLIHPYGSLSDNAWIKKASKSYYIILFPLIVILFIAVSMRIDEYGITINRYIILLLGIWLTIVCLYFTVGKTNIKFIPTSLAAILIIMSFGPWSMFSISEKSQVNRLKNILEQVKIIEDQRIKQEVPWVKDSLPDFHSPLENTHETILTDSLHNEVKSILDYLDDHHGFSSIKTWYKQDLDSMINLSNDNTDRWSQKNEAEIYMRTLGLKYEYRNTDNKNLYFSYNTNEGNTMNVKGYDYLIAFDQYGYDDDQVISSFSIDSQSYTLNYSFKKPDFLQLKNERETISLNAKYLIDSLLLMYGKKETNNIPSSKMRLAGSCQAFDFKVEFERINFDGTSTDLKTNSLSGNIFITLKPKP